MSWSLDYTITPEEYISRLEDIANKDMFDPSQYTFDANLKYLDSLIDMSKHCSSEKNYEDGYIGFRRFQIVLNCLQQHNLYEPEDPRLVSINMRSRQIQSIVNRIRQYIEDKVNTSNANTRSVFHGNAQPSSDDHSDVLSQSGLQNSSKSYYNGMKATQSLSSSHTAHSSLDFIRSASLDSSRIIEPKTDSKSSDPVTLPKSPIRETLDYIISNLDQIPDIREVPMHVGLPLPDDELDCLLSLV